MPNMDGISYVLATRRIRNVETTPVLFVPGSGDRNSRIRAWDAGANDFIGKPFEGIKRGGRNRVCEFQPAVGPGRRDA